jgi:hypothetical protein
VELDFLVAGANKVVDDVRGRRVATSAAEPLTAGETFDDATGVVNTAVGAYPGN